MYSCFDGTLRFFMSFASLSNASITYFFIFLAQKHNNSILFTKIISCETGPVSMTNLLKLWRRLSTILWLVLWQYLMNHIRRHKSFICDCILVFPLWNVSQICQINQVLTMPVVPKEDVVSFRLIWQIRVHFETGDLNCSLFHFLNITPDLVLSRKDFHLNIPHACTCSTQHTKRMHPEHLLSCAVRLMDPRRFPHLSSGSLQDHPESHVLKFHSTHASCIPVLDGSMGGWQFQWIALHVNEDLDRFMQSSLIWIPQLRF